MARTGLSSNTQKVNLTNTSWISLSHTEGIRAFAHFVYISAESMRELNGSIRQKPAVETTTVGHTCMHCTVTSMCSAWLVSQQLQTFRPNNYLNSLQLPLRLSITFPGQCCAPFCCFDLDLTAPSKHVDSLHPNMLASPQQVTCRSRQRSTTHCAHIFAV